MVMVMVMDIKSLKYCLVCFFQIIVVIMVFYFLGWDLVLIGVCIVDIVVMDVIFIIISMFIVMVDGWIVGIMIIIICIIVIRKDVVIIIIGNLCFVG